MHVNVFTPSRPIGFCWSYCLSGGGDDDVPCMCAHVWCYATVALLLHTCEMLLNSCVALAQMLDATQLMGWVPLHVRAGWGGGVLAYAHMWDATQLIGVTWGGGMMTSVACGHMWDATQLMGWVGGMMMSLAILHPTESIRSISMLLALRAHVGIFGPKSFVDSFQKPLCKA